MYLPDLALNLAGTVTEQVSPADPTPKKWVYQRTTAGAGNIAADPERRAQRRAHVIPADPKTAAQIGRRWLFRQAVAAWRALTPSEKAAWKPTGDRARIGAYAAFLSHYLRNNAPPPPVPGVQWDGGSTYWDTAATDWDDPAPTTWDAGATAWDGHRTFFDRP